MKKYYITGRNALNPKSERLLYYSRSKKRFQLASEFCSFESYSEAAKYLSQAFVVDAVKAAAIIEVKIQCL
jgi:hypothetical protein